MPLRVNLRHVFVSNVEQSVNSQSYLAITSWPTTGPIGHCWTTRDKLASFQLLWTTTTTD